MSNAFCAPRQLCQRHRCGWLQVLGMALEYEGAPLMLQRKQDFIAKKVAEKEAAREQNEAARAQVR